jgi:hypothetical protein
MLSSCKAFFVGVSEMERLAVFARVSSMSSRVKAMRRRLASMTSSMELCDRGSLGVAKVGCEVELEALKVAPFRSVIFNERAVSFGLSRVTVVVRRALEHDMMRSY